MASVNERRTRMTIGSTSSTVQGDTDARLKYRSEDCVSSTSTLQEHDEFIKNLML
jgi:hypothetical protein